MSKIYISNLSGTNIQAGAVNIPPGTWTVENTSEFRATWNDGTNMSINANESCHVATFGAMPTVEVIDTVSDNFSSLMIGFSFIFCMGLMALGARWVGKILGYVSNE